MCGKQEIYMNDKQLPCVQRIAKNWLYLLGKEECISKQELVKKVISKLKTGKEKQAPEKNCASQN